MLTPETVLQSRYRVVRQLGQGGMGAVYEAIDERLDSTIALKETFFADERLRKQFEREARLLARMHHPALPRVSDHFSEGEGQFLVMHFIAGDDLAEMSAKRGGPFPTEQVLTWADQLLDALDYLAHARSSNHSSRHQATELKTDATRSDYFAGFRAGEGSSGRNFARHDYRKHFRLHAELRAAWNRFKGWAPTPAVIFTRLRNVVSLDHRR